MKTQRERFNPVTVGQLPKSPVNLAITCVVCREQFSATQGDYFNLSMDHEMRCTDCDNAPMVLTAKESRLIVYRVNTHGRLIRSGIL